MVMASGPINETVKQEIENAVLCWLATVDEDGFPTVSPKQIWDCYDANTLVVADIASPGSVRNIQQNPAACVSFLDVFRQKGFKLIGTARIVPPQDPAFPDLSAKLVAAAGERFEVRNVIALNVTRARPIIAPSYALYRASEHDMKQDAYATYGVRPVSVD